ncbi:hypothetical protein D3C85_1727470 [compost metagenome]
MLLQLDKQRGAHGIDLVINALGDGRQTFTQQRVGFVQKQYGVFGTRQLEQLRNIL